MSGSEAHLNSYSVFLSDEEKTADFGRKLAQAFKSGKEQYVRTGFNIRLTGDLGAGKTFLVRSFLRSLGFEGKVKSPTFSLLETYLADGVLFSHFDFYRFEDPEEFEDAGFREQFGEGKVVFSEWTAKAEPFVPAADIEISLSPEGEGRRARVCALTENGAQFAEALSL